MHDIKIPQAVMDSTRKVTHDQLRKVW